MKIREDFKENRKIKKEKFVEFQVEFELSVFNDFFFLEDDSEGLYFDSREEK